MNWVGEQKSKEDEQDFEGSLDRLSLSIGMSSRSQSSLNSITVSILYKFTMLEVAISSSRFLMFFTIQLQSLPTSSDWLFIKR